MRPLVAVRRAAAFDPRFLDRSPLFWPLRRAAGAVSAGADFPAVEDLARVFEGSPPPVRFVPASPVRRRREPLDVRRLYDARVTLEGVVPTRDRCWHDFMNALVWGTFPRAKRALHARQHRAIEERLAPEARTLPPTRSPELDALALVDEGGIVVVTAEPDCVRSALRSRVSGALRSSIATGASVAVVFGHAIYESLALGVDPAVAGVVVIAGEPCHANRTSEADALLAACIADGEALRSPRELTRVDVAEACPIDLASTGDRAAAPA
jgi:hypothetical protein